MSFTANEEAVPPEKLEVVSLPRRASAASAASAEIPASDFPVDALPPTMREMVEAVARHLQVPEALAACCALPCVSAAVGPGLEIETTSGRTLRGNIYVAVGVPSGAGKTETFNLMLEPIFSLQEWLEAEAQERLARLEVDKVVVEAQIKRLKAEIIAYADVGEDAPALRDKLAALLEQHKHQPFCPRIVCDDSTGAALEKLLARNAMLSASDEAGGAILGNLAGRFTKGTDESIYVRAYSGGRHGGVDRISRHSLKVDRPCLTVLWLMQPNKLHALYAHKGFREDGLLARVLTCRIDTQPHEVDPDNNDNAAISREIKSQWQQLLDDLYAAYHLSGNTPFVLAPTGKASRELIRYHNEVVERRLKDLADVDSFAARWTEQARRLSVVLHAARHGNQAHRHKVKWDQTVEGAVRLADWFSDQQLGLLEQSRIDANEEMEKRVLQLLRLMPGEKDWVTARDLVTAHIIPTALEASQLLNRMKAADKLGRQEHKPAHGGHTEYRYYLK